MKHISIVALAILVSASLSTVQAASKKDKKESPKPVSISSATDSLSYAAGYEATSGLVPFIQQQYKVDTTYMADFVTSFQEALKNATDTTPQGRARAAGIQIAQMVTDRILPGMKEQLKRPDINDQIFYKGFIGALTKDPSVFANVEKATQYRTNTLMAAGENWLKVNSVKPGVKTLPDGLQYKVIVEGTGEKPQKTDEVEVIYEGRLIDGTVFDASYKHCNKKKDDADITPDKFKAGDLIKGWTEALTMMPVGSKWEIYVPQELAYGAREAGQIKPYSTLIFEVELLGIEK